MPVLSRRIRATLSFGAVIARHLSYALRGSYAITARPASRRELWPNDLRLNGTAGRAFPGAAGARQGQPASGSRTTARRPVPASSGPATGGGAGRRTAVPP